jgi:hypothetical protein
MPDDKTVREFQEQFRTTYGKELTLKEAEEALDKLVELAKVLQDIAWEERCRRSRLRDHPEGFHLEDHEYNCRICYAKISGEQSWYDKYGISCIACRDARRKNILPAAAYRDRDSWYSMWEFSHYWNVKPATVRKFMRAGKLKARIVPISSFHIFMIKDNEGFLPLKPKQLKVRTSNNCIRVGHEKVKSPFAEHSSIKDQPTSDKIIEEG